jgi:hypothetical protein
MFGSLFAFFILWSGAFGEEEGGEEGKRRRQERGQEEKARARNFP